jgi:mannose/cellobiose epimerase-like protein (N-acyl-D-glucosamine 2-epimerase family)
MIARLETLETLYTSKPSYENVTINNNITNNIQVNAFNHEDLSHISKSFIERCVKRTNKGLVELVEQVHFSEKATQNNNIRITNKKLPLIQVHNGDKWSFRKEKILSEVFDKGHSIMQEHFDDNEDELKSNMSTTMFGYIKEWLEKMSDYEKKTMETVLTDIYLLIVNNS